MGWGFLGGYCFGFFFFHKMNRIISDFNPLSGIFLLCQFFHWPQRARNPVDSHSRMLGHTTG